MTLARFVFIFLCFTELGLLQFQVFFYYYVINNRNQEMNIYSVVVPTFQVQVSSNVCQLKQFLLFPKDNAILYCDKNKSYWMHINNMIGGRQ